MAKGNEIDTASDIVKQAKKVKKKAPKNKYYCLIYKNGKLFLRVEKKTKKAFKGTKLKYEIANPGSEITVSDIFKIKTKNSKS